MRQPQSPRNQIICFPEKVILLPEIPSVVEFMAQREAYIVGFYCEEKEVSAVFVKSLSRGVSEVFVQDPARKKELSLYAGPLLVSLPGELISLEAFLIGDLHPFLIKPGQTIRLELLSKDAKKITLTLEPRVKRVTE